MERQRSNVNHRWGYGYVILAAILWASSGTAAKFLFNSGVSPFQLVQMRLTVCVVTLFVWLRLRNPDLLRISRRDIPYFAVLGVFGIAGVQFFYLLAISKINVAAAILLEYLAPAFIALYMIVFAGEKISALVLTACGVSVIGCYLVVGAYNLNVLTMNAIGILGGIGAAICFAWYSLHGEYGMRRYNPWTVFFYASLFAAVFWNILYPPLKAFRQAYSLEGWMWIAYVSIMGTILPFGFYFQGVNFIRSTRASITATLEPIGAGLIAYLFLGEVMTPLQMTGGMLVIGSIVLLQLKHEVDDKAPSVLRSRRVDNGAR